jgi:2-oxoglutarate ferredoxin oxidoreductase subunit alpha
MIKRFKKVLVPEINNGQLVKILRDKYLVDAIPYNKIMGIPITKTELVDKMREMLLP